jgi:hypothetical protein
LTQSYSLFSRKPNAAAFISSEIRKKAGGEQPTPSQPVLTKRQQSGLSAGILISADALRIARKSPNCFEAESAAFSCDFLSV